MRIPFVLGTTGHRRLHTEDLDALRASISTELTSLLALLPHTPVRVLTCLAEGADRLVAQVALDLKHEGLELVAVLPMPAEAYAEDFDARSSAEFARLRGECIAEVVMPTRDGAEWCDEALEALRNSKELRDEQYLTAGAWIVRHCSLLFALWDGQTALGVGGTAQVVSAMRLGLSLRGAHVSLDPADVGPVIHIWARREGDPREPRARRVRRLLPELLLATDEAGADVSRSNVMERVGAPHLQRANERLAAIEGSFEQASPSAEVTPYDAVYRAFDTLAQDARDERAEIAQRMVRYALVAILLVSTYDLLSTISATRTLLWTPLLLVPCLLSAVAALRLFRRAKDASADVTRTDYRALAESLRVQRGWWLAGLKDQVSDHFLLRQEPSETLWLRLALRALTVDLRPAPQRKDRAGLKAAYRTWVVEQRDFFYRRALSEQRSRSAVDRSRRVLLGTAATLICALLVVHSGLILGHPQQESESDSWVGWLGTGVDLTLLAIAVITAFAAARSSVVESLGSGQNARTYGWGAARFKLAAERLDELIASNDTEHSREFLLQLGRLALEENGAWLLAQRARPLEAPELS